MLSREAAFTSISGLKNGIGLGLCCLKWFGVFVSRILNLRLLPGRTANVTVMISELARFAGGLCAGARVAAYGTSMSCRRNTRHNRGVYRLPAILRKRSFFVYLNYTSSTCKSVDNLLSFTHLQGNGLEWNQNLQERPRKKRSMLSGMRMVPPGTEF